MKHTLTRLTALLLAPPAFISLQMVSTADTGGARLRPVPIPQVVIDDGFWSPKLKTSREVTIPDCLAKFEKDGTLVNFDRIRDGQLQEKHNGPPWYDGLLYEMIRGCAAFLAARLIGTNCLWNATIVSSTRGKGNMDVSARCPLASWRSAFRA